MQTGSNLRNVQIKHSKVCSGVGLFPIDNILKGAVVFNYLNSEYPSTFDISHLSSKKKLYLNNIWGIFNMIPSTPIFHPVNFLNHSVQPTVIYETHTGNYIATRDLNPTDEITINYIGYNNGIYTNFICKKTKKGGSKRTRKKFIY